MAEADLEAGLKSLRKNLRQIKVLLAWEQLKQAEAKPGRPPGNSYLPPLLHVASCCPNENKKAYLLMLLHFILCLTLVQDAVVRKLSPIFSIIITNLFIGTEKLRTSSGMKGRAETSNIPKTPLGRLDLFSI